MPQILACFWGVFVPCACFFIWSMLYFLFVAPRYTHLREQGLFSERWQNPVSEKMILIFGEKAVLVKEVAKQHLVSTWRHVTMPTSGWAAFWLDKNWTFLDTVISLEKGTVSLIYLLSRSRNQSLHSSWPAVTILFSLPQVSRNGVSKYELVTGGVMNAHAHDKFSRVRQTQQLIGNLIAWNKCDFEK